MMSPRALVLLLVMPLLVLGQNTTNGTDSSGGSTITTTIFSTSVGLGPGRSTTTAVFSSVATTVIGPTPTGNNTSNNSTVNSTISSSSSSTSKNLPTAPTDVAGGGTAGAPSPGKSSANGVYGPDDSYIAAATTLALNAVLGCLVASGIAGALLIM